MDYMIDGGEFKTGRTICGYKIQKMDILKKLSGGKRVLIIIFPNLEEEIEMQLKCYLSEFDTIVSRLVDYERSVIPRSYSETNEDLVILDLLKRLEIQNPSYIDLGVCHPVIRNNTYLLYEQGYTDGILIEPNIDMCRLISEYRPKNRLLQIGATGDTNKKSLRYYMSLNKSYRGHNTFIKEIADQGGFSDNYRDIPVYNINQIIEDNCESTPDLLDIDVEGMDYDILRGLNLKKYRFKIICVEEWKSMEEKFWDIFEGNGYVHYMSCGENKIYVAEESFQIVGDC